MKAVAKVNTDGLYLEDKLVDDAFWGVVPFYEQPETTISDGDEIEEREPVISGYIVGVPFPEGFGAYVTEGKAFRFNLETLLWEEGLTVEEIAELTKPTDQGQDASEVVGQQLAEMKIQAIQQTQLLASMGAELAATKLELINLKGANQS
ncbi:hypothetical protein ACU1JV_15335 [Paenibacillus sp. T2-29]|uniref:hypothetical protein n=1 Tax=Paenibacillus TaxID=44249 RepID=UPI0039BC6533